MDSQNQQGIRPKFHLQRRLRYNLITSTTSRIEFVYSTRALHTPYSIVTPHCFPVYELQKCSFNLKHNSCRLPSIYSISNALIKRLLTNTHILIIMYSFLVKSRPFPFSLLSLVVSRYGRLPPRSIPSNYS